MKIVNQIVYILLRENHGWLKLNDIVVDTIWVEENLAVLAGETDKFSDGAVRLLGFSAFDEVYSVEEAYSSDITDNLVLFVKLLQSLSKVLSDDEGVFLQIIFADDFESGRSSDAGNWITTVGVEVRDSEFFEAISYFLGADYSRDGESVTHGFSESYDIRDDIVLLETPEIGSYSAHSTLDFIDDTDSSLASDDLENFFEVVFGGDDLTGTALESLRDEGGYLFILQLDIEFFCVFLGCIRSLIFSSVLTRR